MPENLNNTAIALDRIWKAITYYNDIWQHLSPTRIDYG